MTSCTACDKELSGSSALECSQCHNIYCHNHLHDHDCTPTPESTEQEVEDNRNKNQRTRLGGIVPQIGYLLSGIAAVIATIYLLNGIDVIISGGGLRELVALVVAGSFYSLATFLLVGAWIKSRP